MTGFLSNATISSYISTSLTTLSLDNDTYAPYLDGSLESLVNSALPSLLNTPSDLTLDAAASRALSYNSDGVDEFVSVVELLISSTGEINAGRKGWAAHHQLTNFCSHRGGRSPFRLAGSDGVRRHEGCCL